MSYSDQVYWQRLFFTFFCVQSLFMADNQIVTNGFLSHLIVSIADVCVRIRYSGGQYL